MKTHRSCSAEQWGAVVWELELWPERYRLICCLIVLYIQQYSTKWRTSLFSGSEYSLKYFFVYTHKHASWYASAPHHLPFHLHPNGIWVGIDFCLCCVWSEMNKLKSKEQMPWWASAIWQSDICLASLVTGWPDRSVSSGCRLSRKDAHHICRSTGSHSRQHHRGNLLGNNQCKETFLAYIDSQSQPTGHRRQFNG